MTYFTLFNLNDKNKTWDAIEIIGLKYPEKTSTKLNQAWLTWLLKFLRKDHRALIPRKIRAQKMTLSLITDIGCIY